ncbi:uncharacterized protein ASPGLDRAFT_1471508 [Aspergillus glaucus CBS 516.65]|uniref:Uncharacterized protein n=1 Tax=Aspergillus glaucus CBS 516.65 TaxID=1160497 RepID=A0A1L9VLK6_ASPGL|nr:hypothetical protein ASPGLDRAFT_1471508 [Aspergillus glaucus CBS 516.65]OJJ84771.1 hypothetical protein ASPGLDRAFT_1471508 [Aspergillus glaucus CBS 516.65]
MWYLNEYNEDRSGLIQMGIEMLAVITDCGLSEIPSVCPIPADLDQLFLWHSKDWPSMAHGILSVCYDNCTPIKERVQSQARTDGVPQAEGWAKCPFPACHRIEKPGNNTEKSGDSRKLDLRPANVLRLYLQYLSHLVQTSPTMPLSSRFAFEDAALRAQSSPYLIGYDPHAHIY